jgi:hypothetical protein
MTAYNFCFYLQNTKIQISQTGGKRFSDTSPFSIPWPKCLTLPSPIFCWAKAVAVVEQLPRHLRVDGSSLSTGTGTIG